MSSLSHREFLVISKWLDSHEEEPQTTDYYLMRIAAAVDHVLSSSKSIDLNQYKIKFERKSVPQRSGNGVNASPLSLDEQTALARQILLARFGKIQGLDHKGNVIND